MSKTFILFLIPIFIGWTASAKGHKRKPAEAERDEMTAAEVVAPGDGEVCFSPDELCDLKLVKFVDSAKSSLDIAIYDINLDQLVHTILVKSKQIPVRVVVDRRQAQGSHSAVALLIKAGASLKYGAQRGIMHDKFMIVDGKRVEMGSFNYTHHAAFANQENQLYLGSAPIVERYKTRFEKMWSGAKPVANTRTLSSE